MTQFAFGGRAIGQGRPCFIVAEIGANHDGDPQRCLEMVRMAADCGADAIKLQTYSAAELVSDPQRIVAWGPPGRERREPVGAMFDRLALPRQAHPAIFEEARRLGMEAFSTPFSLDALDFLQGLEPPGWKIASSDVGYLDMLQAMGGSGRPVILSTGKHTLAEVDEAVRVLRAAGCRDLALLHCIAKYPAPMDQMALRSIPALAAVYADAVIGLSDHSIGIVAALGAVALGAKVIEKHVTYDKAADGPDHWFSADPAELKALVEGVREMEAALGAVQLGVTDCEIVERRDSIRSLVLARDVPAGQPIALADLTARRPGWGISPMRRDEVAGMAAKHDLAAGAVLTWDLLRAA